MTVRAKFDPGKRHDFALLFDVTDGNPNGDPDAGNLPRIDPETMQGLVTDGAIKRKIRNFVDVSRGEEPGYLIYVQERGILNRLHERAYVALDQDDELKLPSDAKSRVDYLKSPPAEDREKARRWMCRNFYDVRAFGAVMTTAVNCGQVRGPVQLTFARSVDPILPIDVAITRVALTNAVDIRGGQADDEEARSGQMGRKSIVPYGLYLCHGFFNPHLATATGFDETDLQLLFESLVKMWDIDRSASRGLMACRGIYVFSHSSSLGDAPAHQLFDALTIQRATANVPRSIRDYAIAIDEQTLPDGVTLHRID